MLVLSSQARLLGRNPVVWLCGQEPVRTFQKGPSPEKAKCCGLFLGNSLVLLCLLFLEIPNPKLTNLAGSLDGAPIHRHFTNSKTQILSIDRSILQHFIHTVGIRCFLSIHRLQCDCDCDLRACCAAAVRSHNTTPPLRPRRGLIPLGRCHMVAPGEQAPKKGFCRP